MIQFYAGIVPGWKNVESDFPNYYTASRIIIEGRDIDKLYDDHWFNSRINEYGIEQQGKFSPFPPVTAFLMIPLVIFEPLNAKRIWTLVNILLLIFTIVLLNRITGWSYTWLGIFILLCGLNLANNFRFGQFYIALLFMIVFSYYLWLNGKKRTAGILLGIAISVKYFPVVFLIPFALHRKFNIVFSALLSIVLISIVEILVFGWDGYTHYLFSVLLPHLNGNLSGQSDYAMAFQSWNSMLYRLFIPHIVENPSPLINWAPGFIIFKTGIHLLIGGLAIFALFRVMKKSPSQSLQLQLAICGITALVLLPASATYHFNLLIFPVILLFKNDSPVISDITSLLIIACYIMIGFIPLLFPLNMSLSGYGIFLAYPRLWVVTLLFFTSLLYISHLTTAKSKNSIISISNNN